MIKIAGGLDLGSLTLSIAVKTGSAKTALNDIADQAEKVTSKFDNMKKVGESLTSIGKTLTKALTIPLVTLGTTVGHLGIDFEQSMAIVQATAGATTEELEKLKDLARDVGANTQFSAREAADGLNYLAQAGWTTEEMLVGYNDIVNMSIATQLDLATCTDIVSSSLTAFGLGAKDVGRFCDVLTIAANRTNTDVQELGDAFSYVAPTAGALGYSIEDVAAALGIMSNAGVKGSMAGTSLRGVLTALTDEVTLNGEAFEELTVQTQNSDGTMRDLKDIIVDLRAGFVKMTDAEKAQNAEMIAGKTGMSGLLALMNTSEEEFRQVTNEIQNSTGATQEFADIVGNTTSGQIKNMMSALEECALQFADALIPYVQKGIECITNLATKLQELSPATKEAIVKIVAFAAAIGPLLAVGGKLVTVCTKIVSAFKDAAAATTLVEGAMALLSSITVPLVALLGTLAVAVAGVTVYTETMNQSILESEEEMGFLEKAVAKLTGTVTYSKKELEDMGAVYSDFNENISPEFQQAVNDMTVDFHDFSMELEKFNLDGVITQEEANAVANRVSELVQSCQSVIESKSTEVQNTLKNLLASDGTWSEIDQATFDYWQNYYSVNSEEALRIQSEINAIINQAAADGRDLTPEEEQAIRDKYARIQQIELECEANNSQELLYARKEFQNRVNIVDAEGAAKLWQQRQEQFAEQQIEIASNYDTLIAMEKEHQDGMTEEELQASQKRIDNLEEAKQEQLEKNKEFYDKDWEYLQEHCGALEETVDKYNGDIMDKTDKTCNENFEKMKNHYRGLENITEDGMYSLYNTTSDTYEDIIVNVDEATGEIIGLTRTWTDEYGTHTGEITGYNKDIEDSTRDMQSKLVQDINRITRGLNDGSLSYNESTGEIVDANGKVVGSIKEVYDENGLLVQSILDVNGKPVNISGNWGDAKKGANSVTDAINSIPPTRSVTVTTNYIQKYNNQGPGPTMYAEGTDSAARGIAMVGEEGPELVLSRSGQALLANSATLMNMAGGEKVYTASETANLFKNLENLSKFVAMQSAYASIGISKSDIRKMVDDVLKVAPVKDNGKPINVALNLDGRQVAKVMVKPFEQELSRVQRGRKFSKGNNLI